ncbi:hypothetical protein [Pseudoalteromonas sp. SR41-7]|uniref:hypothetical protein n=1 Tax=Pseudoalteromonas sp. SR41-7 TaxID=2760947 RepID=UPI0016000BB5|nr:hypothetical protein [Pseudoalteromonas sp. SR41-7]MBB1298294.1 hypothetical protein [Pseudoalteromonas sp. SR41-7]
MTKKLNTILLGGSNSIMSGALKSGLGCKSSLHNFAIGASSVVQNASELSKNRQKIINADLVITESNVNDSHNVNVLNAPINFMVEKISEYYLELSKLNKNCVVFILPVKFIEGKTESIDIIEEINNAHRANAINHGFYIVDLALYFKELSSDVMDMVMPDPRHVNNSYMYNIGVNVIAYFTSLKNVAINKDKLILAESNYSFLNANLFGSIETKQNSMFEAELLELDEGEVYTFPKSSFGYYLIGIATWSDGDSAIEIASKKNVLRKAFNNLNAFNELLTPIKIDESTQFSTIKVDIKTTEASVNVSDFINCNNNTRLAGFYVAKNLVACDLSYETPLDSAYSRDLDFLIPDVMPYFHSVKFFLSRVSITKVINLKYNNSKADASTFYANLVKDAAVFFINKDNSLAYKLMRLALFINPKNRLAKKWLKNRKSKK